MTVMDEKTGSAAPAPAGPLSAARDHVVQISGAPVEFTGVLVAHATSRRAGQVQWTELTLYSTPGMRRVRYVVLSSGMSVLYHRPSGGCNTGQPATVGSLSDLQYDEMQPCSRCCPADLEDMSDDAVVMAEVTLNRVIMAHDARDLLRKLRWTGKKKWATSIPVLSRVAEMLLARAAETCPDIAEELLRPRRLGDEEDSTYEDDWPRAAGQAG